MARPIDDETEIGIGDWVRQIYDDEVMFWSEQSCIARGGAISVSQYPLVPGFFVTDYPDEYINAGGACTRILAGPFDTLEIAIASIALTS